MEKEHHIHQEEQEDRMKEKPGKRPDKAGMGRFIKLIASAHPPKAILIIALILTLIQTMAGLIVPMMTKGLIDGLTFSSLNRMVIVGLLGAFVIQAVASAVSIYMLNYAGHKIVANLRKRLWHKILSLPIPYFDRNRSGDTMSRVTNDTSLIMNLITEYLVNLISNVIAIIGGIALLFYLDWVMTLIIMAIVPLTALILFPVGRKMYRISKKQQDEMADLTSVLSQVIGEIRLVKAYGTESREAQAGEDRIYRMFRFGLQESRILYSCRSNFYLLVDCSTGHYIGGWWCSRCIGCADRGGFGGIYFAAISGDHTDGTIHDSVFTSAKGGWGY